MQDLTGLIAQYGPQYVLAIVFANVLADQLGVPIPAIPVLVVAGALAAGGRLSALEVFGVAMLGGMLGDLVWFAAGRRYGHRVLKTLCAISLSPDSCVRQTESFYERWGVGMLVFAKFVPGLSTVAPPLAGAMRLGTGAFLIFNGIGSAVWAGLSIGAGLLFHTRITQALHHLTELGALALYLAATALAAFIAIKWWERQRFYKTLRMARISADELRRLVRLGDKPVILDVRSEAARKLDTRTIPGAHPVDVEQPDAHLSHLAPGAEIIVYCTCPNEATAARVARLLMDRGFKRVRPLTGGLDAWFEAAGDTDASG